MNLKLLNQVCEELKSRSLFSFFILSILSFSYLTAQENEDPFTAGETVEVFLNTTDVTSSGDYTGGQFVATSGGYHHYIVADDSGTYTGVSAVSGLSSSGNNVSPMLGVGDVVVFRNASVDTGMIDYQDFDVTVEVIEIVDFPGTVETSDADNDAIIGTASTTRFVQPNTSSGNTISFSIAANNAFDGGSSIPTADTSAKMKFTIYEAGTFTGPGTGTELAVSPSFEIKDIDNYITASGTDNFEFVSFNATQFAYLYFSSDTLLIPTLEGDILNIESTGTNDPTSNIDSTACATAGLDCTPDGTEEQLAVRFNGSNISSFEFLLGSHGTPVHKGPNFQLASTDPPIISITENPTIINGDNDGDGVVDVDDLDDDNDGILDVNEACDFASVAGFPITSTTTVGAAALGTQTTLATATVSADLDTEIDITITGQTGTSNAIISVLDSAGNLIGYQLGTEDFSSADGTLNFSLIVNVRTETDITIVATDNVTATTGYSYLVSEIDIFQFCDSDGDGFGDYVDTDTDNDGCPDTDEVYGYGTDTDGLGTYASTTDADVNADGTITGLTY